MRITLPIIVLVAVAMTGRGNGETTTAPATSSRATTQRVTGQASASQPAKTAATQESGATDKLRDDPFSPSALMRDRAKKAAASDSPQGPAASAKAASDPLPVLEGVVVKGTTAVACFRVGEISVMVEPGDLFPANATTFSFIAYENEAAVVKDANGRTWRIRTGLRPSTGKAKALSLDAADTGPEAGPADAP